MFVQIAPRSLRQARRTFEAVSEADTVKTAAKAWRDEIKRDGEQLFFNRL